MKKFTTVFGLLSLMLLLTSFTSPVEIGGRNTQGEIYTTIGGRNTQGEIYSEIGGRNTQGE